MYEVVSSGVDIRWKNNWTSPTGGTEAIVGLVPFHLHLWKLATQADYRVATLSGTHPTRSLLRGIHVKDAIPHPKSLTKLSVTKC